MRIEFATGRALSYPLQFSWLGTAAIIGCPVTPEVVEDEGNYSKVAAGQWRTIKFAVSLDRSCHPAFRQADQEASPPPNRQPVVASRCHAPRWRGHEFRADRIGDGFAQN